MGPAGVLSATLLHHILAFPCCWVDDQSVNTWDGRRGLQVYRMVFLVVTVSDFAQSYVPAALFEPDQTESQQVSGRWSWVCC